VRVEARPVVRIDCKADPPPSAFAVVFAVLAAQAQRPFTATQASKARHHISARLRPVNRKMDKLMQIQTVAAAW
jgi:hypothetical protein